MGHSFFVQIRVVHRVVQCRVSGTYSLTTILAMEVLIGEVMELDLATSKDVNAKCESIRIDHHLEFIGIVLNLCLLPWKAEPGPLDCHTYWCYRGTGRKSVP